MKEQPTSTAEEEEIDGNQHIRLKNKHLSLLVKKAKKAAVEKFIEECKKREEAPFSTLPYVKAIQSFVLDHVFKELYPSEE